MGEVTKGRTAYVAAIAIPATRQTRRLEKRRDSRPPNGMLMNDPIPRQTSTRPTVCRSA
jgi:hypothetical protein